MKIKAKWGFIGNPDLLRSDHSRVKAGQEFPDVDDEYAIALIGKGLAEEVKDKAAAKPKETKPAATPKEGK
ncbi:hypothetical protein PSGK_18905 [Pseudomonas solani]|uniref:DUF7302 family protein n=1 Tax=Pseudomonas TaxID=286 RepID=UPI001F35B77A|nr:hypothetical protein [Pseudomonas tohonis]